jgi:hypothetical protein
MATRRRDGSKEPFPIGTLLVVHAKKPKPRRYDEVSNCSSASADHHGPIAIFLYDDFENRIDPDTGPVGRYVVSSRSWVVVRTQGKDSWFEIIDSAGQRGWSNDANEFDIIA